MLLAGSAGRACDVLGVSLHYCTMLTRFLNEVISLAFKLHEDHEKWKRRNPDRPLSDSIWVKEPSVGF